MPDNRVSWTPEEDHDLVVRFKEGIPLKKIVKIHQRKCGAICNRLKKHGLIRYDPAGLGWSKKNMRTRSIYVTWREMAYIDCATGILEIPYGAQLDHKNRQIVPLMP